MERGMRTAITMLFTLSLFAACGGDDGSAAPPAAPSMLTAELLSGGAHLTWKDNSSDETQFMIQRKEMGGTADYATVATTPFNTTTYHDAPLTSGKTYLYMVMAHNDAGETASKEVSIAIP